VARRWKKVKVLNWMSMPKALVEPPAASLLWVLECLSLKSLSLKEDWRIISFKHSERVKGR
jgi:hypothetical protein